MGLLRSLPGYPRYRMVGEEEEGQWGLEISSVSSADDGLYQCQVSAQDGDPAIRSGEARLSVMSPPGQPLILEGEEVMISQGEELQLTCVSRGGRPAGEVTLAPSHQRPETFKQQIFNLTDWDQSKKIKL